MFTAVVAVICIFLGGWGGYEWGRSVEAKAQALLAEAKAKAGQIKSVL